MLEWHGRGQNVECGPEDDDGWRQEALGVVCSSSWPRAPNNHSCPNLPSSPSTLPPPPPCLCAGVSNVRQGHSYGSTGVAGLDIVRVDGDTSQLAHHQSFSAASANRPSCKTNTNWSSQSPVRVPRKCWSIVTPVQWVPFEQLPAKWSKCTAQWRGQPDKWSLLLAHSERQEARNALCTLEFSGECGSLNPQCVRVAH